MERLKRFGLLVLVVGGMGACGAGLDQRILSATATAAVTADRSARTLYLAEADRVLQTAEDRDESFAWYCRSVQGVWGRMADLQCAAVALGTLAIEGQEAVNVGGSLGLSWLAGACGAVDAVIVILDALDEPVPSPLVVARTMLCQSTNRLTRPAPCLPEIVPGCEEEVSP